MLLANICSSQVNEQFDNDLAKWSGTTTHFVINANRQLQLNNTAAGSSYVVTTFAPTDQDLEWNVYVKQAFAGSASNYGRIYLLSSQQNLTEPTDGYYLQLGESGNSDAVELFRQTGTTSVSVCRAANASIASSFAIRIKVLRYTSGLWKVFIDYAGGTDFIEAASGVDLTYTSGSWMGFLCVYTSGNATRFYYDDVYAGPVKPDDLPFDDADKNDVVINEFFPDPSPPVGLPEQEFVEVYNRSSKTFDLRNWKIGDASSFVNMPSVVLKPDEYLVITTSNGLPSLNNSGDAIRIVSDKGVLMDSLTYNLTWYHETSKSNGGYTIERLNPDVSSTDVTNWWVSQDASGGTPGMRNSVFGRNPDSTPPAIVSVKYLVDVIVIKFSEPVVPVGTVDGFRAEFKQDSTATIYLTGLTNGLDYKIQLTDFVDHAGNAAAAKEFRFTYFIPHAVNPKDLIITEIMADPSPVVQLPEAEYLEVYNRSGNPVNLAGWRLEDPTTIAKLPSMIIMPDSYLLLTSTTNASKFSKATGVSSFPSLGNLSDRIVLRDSNGIVIDSIAYSLTWYRNSEKAEGGWSLELIDLNNPCGEEDNWTASDGSYGGTPGKVNSVNANKPDVTPPIVLSVTPISDESILIAFNEKLKDTGSISLPGTSRLRYRSIVHVLSERLQTRKLYSLTIANVSDCNGNRMDPVTLEFALPESPSPKDIIINEVLFNPRPGESDFVELYNRSEKYINLKGWKLTGKTINTSDHVMTPGSYYVLDDSNMMMPSMPDNEGTVIVTDSNNVVIDQFTYNDNMHSPILSDTEGVSLERLSPEGNEWHSANASAGYSTPGSPNSSSRPVTVADQILTVKPEVINPSGGDPFSQIFYHLDNGGVIANVEVVDLEGRVVKTLASNETLAAEGSFQWDGDRNGGGLAKSGYYMVWFQVFDLSGEVRIYRKRVVVGF